MLFLIYIKKIAIKKKKKLNNIIYVLKLCSYILKMKQKSSKMFWRGNQNDHIYFVEAFKINI